MIPSKMKFIAIGSNLPHPDHGAPIQVCEAAVGAIASGGCFILRRSRWYRSKPVPVSDQPDFINGVIAVETIENPPDLLRRLHEIEYRFDRVRSVPNAARTLDLDLIDFDRMVNPGPDGPLLPHPRMQERAFVLYPMSEIAPDWEHPVLGVRIDELADRLGGGQHCVPIDD